MIAGKKVGVVIPAAGSGSRIGGGIAKQFLDLHGKPILARTLRQFQSHPAIDTIAIAGSIDGLEAISSIVREENITKVVWIGLGGVHRQDSVWNTLQQLQLLSPDLVLVHDAVRPFVSSEIIDEVINSTLMYGAAVPVVPPKDTIKQSIEGMFIKTTLERTSLWQAQTPQGFFFDVLMKAFLQAGQDNFMGTDDASLVERIGWKVKMVEGSIQNFKITTVEDLTIARVVAEKIL